MSNAIARISAALGYDTAELALVNGSLADALKIAAASFDAAPIGDDTAPESCRTIAVRADSAPATVRPGKWH